MRSLLLVLAVACSSSKELPPPAPAPVPAADAGIAEPLPIAVDKRIELLTIMMRLAGAPEYKTAQHRYAKDVDAKFAAFAKHRAIAETAALRSRGIAYDAPITFAVHLDDKLELVNASELPTLDPRWRGVDVAAYARSVRAFATASKFDAFFTAQRPNYQLAESKTRLLVGSHNPVAFFEPLFGARGGHTVVPGMLLGTNNVGVRSGDASYQVMSTPSLATLVHEMAHPYVNPLLAKHAVALEPAGTALWPLFAQTMRAQTYANWQTMLNEATVRALTVLYIRTHVGDDMGAAAARDEQRAGFPYISELVEVIRAYQREPGDPDALAAQLVGFFSELANRYDGQPPKTPFIGPFDAVLRGDYVLALAPGPLAARVRKLPFFAKVPVVDPDDDVPPGKGIVAYGTPTTNALIAQVAKWASWTIADDGISLGTKRFDGEHLVLIACWFRLQDPTRGVAVYAAADESDLDGINTIKHGPRDWLVARRTARGFEVVATGDWPFGTSTWEPFR